MKTTYLMAALILALVAPALAQVNLTANETYLFSYVNVTNTTTNETFYCEAPLFCASSSLTIDLYPGQNVTYVNGTCSAFATCNAPVPPSCNIVATITPGQTLVQNASGCNVTVTANYTSDRPVVTSNQPQHIVIDKRNGVLVVTVGNYTSGPLADASVIHSENDFTLECTNEVRFDTEKNADEILRVCGEFAPWLVTDWIKPTLESCRDSARTHIDDIKEESARNRELMQRLAQCNLDFAASESKLNETILSIEGQPDGWRQRTYAAENSVSANHASAWVGWVCAIVFFLIALILMIREMRR